MFKCRAVGRCFLVMGFLWWCGPVLSQSVGADSGESERVNLVIIMADDMGYGDSSVYDGWVETPQLERMAREGLKFTDFHSSGAVCSPTRAGLMTGRYQQRAGIPGVVNADPKQPAHHGGLQTSEVTLAEILQGAGYATGIFGKWHLGYYTKYNPLHHGFDQFRGFVSGNIDYISHYDRMQTYDWWDGLALAKREEGYLTHLITRHATQFIKEHKAAPFFLYVPHGAVHSPIQGPGDPPGRGPEAKKKSKRPQEETVRRMFQALDESVGAILETLREEGLAERTLVLFFSDNGGARHCKNTPLRGGKGSVWEGGHRVPAIAWWPGKIRPSGVSDETCISLDVMPTFLDAAGLRYPKDRKLDGVSLLPVLDGRALPHRQLFWNGTAMRDGPWKLVAQAKGLKGQPGLYNLARDIGETDNLAEKEPRRVQRMLRAIEAWKKDVAEDATRQPTAPPAPPER